VEKRIAELLMKEIDAFSAPINAATHLSTQIPEKAEAEAIRRALAKIMDALNFELIRMIVKQYPELDPDQNRE
jgi:hypothetical protein